MGSFAAAMARTVQQIQAAAQTRGDSINQLHHTTQEFLQDCQRADQQRTDELHHRARDLKHQMKSAEKARFYGAQQFMQETRQAIQDIGVRVSELRSDTHNFVQRIAMEHREMAQQLRTQTREYERNRRTLRQQLERDAQHILSSLQNSNRERNSTLRQAMHVVADDLRQGRQIWRQELKKKAPLSAIGVAAISRVPLEERARAQAPGPGEEGIHPPALEGEASPFAIEEIEPTRLASEAERVIQVIADHPEGIRLVEIGNELGVDWRGLIGAVKFLMDEGKVEKIDNVYYPAQPGPEGE